MIHLAVFPLFGRAAHHPQHSHPAGTDESHQARAMLSQVVYSHDTAGAKVTGGFSARGKLWSDHRRLSVVSPAPQTTTNTATPAVEVGGLVNGTAS